MEPYIPISYLNDFIFCPYSIYFHNLYYQNDTTLYHDTYQTEGKIAHSSIEQQSYSTKKNILQNIDVYSEKYGIYGKIDILDVDTATLIERKKQIKTIYDGYIFQLYAQYFALKEMNYTIKKIKLYCMTHNKNYPIPLPEENPKMLEKFEQLVQKIKTFDPNKTPVTLNENKCAKCIYKNICDISLC